MNRQRGSSLPASSIDPQALEDCKSPAVTHHDAAVMEEGVGMDCDWITAWAISIMCKWVLIDLSVNRTMLLINSEGIMSILYTNCCRIIWPITENRWILAGNRKEHSSTMKCKPEKAKGLHKYLNVKAFNVFVYKYIHSTQQRSSLSSIFRSTVKQKLKKKKKIENVSLKKGKNG